MKSRDEENIKCAFCGKTPEEVNKLIAGQKDGVYICDSCVSLCDRMLKDKSSDHGLQIDELPTPVEIQKKLDEYVIGQDEAKRILSVAVYNHYKRINYAGEADVELEKSNIILIGSTGTGKTLLARTLAKFLNVPFAIADATTLTEAGYVGEDVENVILKLVQNANYDKEAAERGIIFIDEVDKISKKGDNPSITRDVSGEGVQQALLKIIEGTIANVPPQGGRKHPEQEYLKIDTTNILFICGGAFDGMEDVIKRRIGKNTLGFGGNSDEHSYHNSKHSSKSSTNREELLKLLEPNDFVKYGLIPEFVGRLPITAALSELDEEALIRILTEPKNSLIKQYEAMLNFDSVKLTFTQPALHAIAKLAIKRKTGARGLRSILENAMLGVMYQVPSMVGNIKEVIINDAVINEGAEPIIIEKDDIVNKKSKKNTDTSKEKDSSKGIA